LFAVFEVKSLLAVQRFWFFDIFLIGPKQWDDSEDRLALVGLGFAALVAVWASANVITVIYMTHSFEY
jgi:hypothetical protein